jgi:hypothetical protein
MGDEVLVVSDVAQIMRCSTRTVAELCAKAQEARDAGLSTAGMLVGFKAGVGRTAGWRVTRRALDAYMGLDLVNAGPAGEERTDAR